MANEKLSLRFLQEMMFLILQLLRNVDTWIGFMELEKFLHQKFPK